MLEIKKLKSILKSENHHRKTMTDISRQHTASSPPFNNPESYMFNIDPAIYI